MSRQNNILKTILFIIRHICHIKFFFCVFMLPLSLRSLNVSLLYLLCTFILVMCLRNGTLVISSARTRVVNNSITFFPIHENYQLSQHAIHSLYYDPSLKEKQTYIQKVLVASLLQQGPGICPC